MRKLLGTLVVLLVLAVAADRIGAYVAERVVADQLRASQRLSSTPDVDIAGFPFLTQFAAGRYRRVSATASNVPVGRTGLRLSRVRVEFRGVTASRDFRSFTARRGTATARVSFDDLGSLLGVTITSAGDGRIKATKTITAGGATVRPTISVAPKLVDDTLTFTAARIEGVSDLPAQARAALERVFGQRLRLSGLPFGISVTDIRVTGSGIELTLAGRDLRYVARSTS